MPLWDGEGSRERVGRQLADDATPVGDRLWIWVHPGLPDALLTSWTGRRHYGDEDLVKWIDRHHPAIVLSGHVHQSPFAPDGDWIDHLGTTVVFNAGRQRGPSRPGSSSTRRRARDVVARGDRRGVLGADLVLGIGIVFGPELMRAPDVLINRPARLDHAEPALRGPRTAA